MAIRPQPPAPDGNHDLYLIVPSRRLFLPQAEAKPRRGRSAAGKTNLLVWQVAPAGGFGKPIVTPSPGQKYDQESGPEDTACPRIDVRQNGEELSTDRAGCGGYRAVRGCDIGLDAPDVSSLHCMIWRGAAGLQIRDCGSRAGTRINGDTVQEAMLHDGDILQIGPFSFRVYVPAILSPIQAKGRRNKHVEKSRRNLGRLAVALRHKISEMAHLMEISGSVHSLDQKASGLRQRVRDYEQRSKQLEQDERDLSRDRDLLEKERAQHQTQRD